MKKILVGLTIVLTILLIVYLFSPWGPKPIATLLNREPAEDLIPMPALYDEGERALQQGNSDRAQLLATRGKQEASDSDEYYHFVVLDAKCHFHTMQSDSFLKSHRQLKQYLRRQKRPTLKQRYLAMELAMQMGVYWTKMAGQMDSAQHYNFLALRRAYHLPGSEHARLLLLSNIADTYKQMGQYDKSVDYFNCALELADSIGGASPSTIITITTGIASAYSAMRSFDKSQQWWDKASLLQPQMSRTEMFHYLNNRGNDLFLQERYEESLQCFLRLDSLIADDEDMLWERMFEHCNLSGLFIKLGQTERARPILDETEQFFTRQKQPIPLYYLITQRIELATKEGRLAEAQRLAEQHPTPEWMIPEQRILRLEEVAKLYELAGQWKQYAVTKKELDRVKDALAGDNMKMRFSEQLLRHEHEQGMTQKQLQLEEKERSLQWATAIVVLAVIVILLLVIILLQKHQKMKLKDSVTESQITALRLELVRNRITPHFIGNALSAEMLAQAEGREVNLDTLVELLNRGIELTGIELSTLSEELEFISFYCSVESRSIGPDFRYEQQVAPDVDTAKVVLPSMSVQILVENAIKHGLKRVKPRDGQLRKVTVRVTRQDEGTLVEVIDNGTGLPEDRRRNERTGLRVIRQTFTMLNKQNRRQVDFGLENYAATPGATGCRAWILLPSDYEYRLNT